MKKELLPVLPAKTEPIWRSCCWTKGIKCMALIVGQVR